MLPTTCACLRGPALHEARDVRQVRDADIAAPADTATGEAATAGSARRSGGAGGAEQYNADKRYAEAVEVAVEECAEDTEGQTCHALFGTRLGRGPRARVRVPRGGGLHARVVPDEAGEDCDR